MPNPQSKVHPQGPANARPKPHSFRRSLPGRGDSAGPRRLLLALALLLATVFGPLATASAEDMTAQQILDAMDKNMTFESRTSKLTMTVEAGKRTRVYEIQSFGRGESDSAMEYLAPAREKGTRMLKLGDDLWMYLPSVDRVQKISGHMLRQGMMGSDLSYEDMMASEQMEDAYTATVQGSEPVDGRDCWKLEMVAKDDTVSYPKRVSWIDKETYIPLKQELFALSGMLLKSWTMEKVVEFPGGRKFPTRMVIQDMIKKDSRTVIEFSDMTFGVELPGEVFSQRWLERK